MKSNRVAYGVRVKLNSQFKSKCLGDDYLKDERILFIRDPKAYNDAKGEYVHITGGSLVNSGYAYMDELDLEFEVPEYPLYSFDEKQLSDEEAAESYVESKDNNDNNGELNISRIKTARLSGFCEGCKFKEEQIKGKTNTK